LSGKEGAKKYSITTTQSRCVVRGERKQFGGDKRTKGPRFGTSRRQDSCGGDHKIKMHGCRRLAEKAAQKAENQRGGGGKRGTKTKGEEKS